MIFYLNESQPFPNPRLAEPDGLLAIGGDLSVNRLLEAYGLGIFPWFNEGDPIMWFSPHERCVIIPEEVTVSRSMKKLLESGKFLVTVDQSFEGVIRSCATIPRFGQDGTWITNEMQKAYIELHDQKHAMSVEVWENDILVGGLYGVRINNTFCGESMFSNVSNASKAALIWLCRNGGFDLIDCQLPNDHLFSLGAKMIQAEEYFSILSA